MESSELFDHVESGTQPEMECIAEDDLRIDIIQIFRGHGLDGTVGSHWHKDGRFNGAVCQFQTPSSGIGRGVDEFKIKHVSDFRLQC